MGKHSQRRALPTSEANRLCGVSVYDVSDGLIQRETMCMDLATLLVALRIEP